MTTAAVKADSSARTIRWAARIWSLLSLGFLLLMFIGEGLGSASWAGLSRREIILMLFFPLGVSLGMLLAWLWEGLGGAFTLASLAAFYTVHYLSTGRFPGGPWFMIVAAPGFLFLLSRLLNAGRGRARGGRPVPRSAGRH
ncbi:MAG: hypothetical protein A3F83_11440 [Candidatus Glassbacteria bacterium RIFCSPLOWO2_12_FULL_58_11]|uniref:DUF7670 domain-containing protein n=2 Tax=Candidatus Glassiibacteriota TaxID=1817805 RepID=A0A1F5Z097_9BACT|nr:MAG: hypothetical protein A2Z86_09560 [Candidatus Glassbacteria bacterium GWA2_58_10]OGG05542.1 MAG: hypothetical protein A3F83_11440 [Candidatus Glassbacteria bacterium RIFCSPLOWO2_12_FULL_58_11]